MPPGNRLTPVSQNAFGAPPTLAEIQLAARTAQRPAPLTLGERAQEINYGLGRGFTNILEGNLGLAKALYQDPRAVGSAFVDAARQFAANPVDTVSNSLRGMWNRAKSSPAGLGEVIGENIDPRNFLKPRKALRQELDVYHGTPHTFDPETGAPLGRFRSQKIGTGEGAQAYGHGLYFAESPDVAKEYQLKLSGVGRVQPIIDQYGSVDAAIAETEKRIVHFRNAVAENRSNPAANAAMLQITKKSLEGSEKALQDLQSIKAGNLGNQGSRYKVDLPDAKIEQMLDWDKPLSAQPKKVQDALKRRIVDVQPTDNFDMGGNARLRDNRMGQFDKTKPYPWLLVANSKNGTSAYGLNQKDVDRMFGKKDAADLTGEQILSRVAQQQGGQAQASEYLRSLGIPGIKYFDAGSRAGEKGTRNFVVFPGEEQSLNILSRD